MIIKKYQGKTEAEAMENAKKELGEGVVLMNVKTVKPKGFSKIFKQSYVEITVAKEEESEVLIRKEKDVSTASVKKSPETKVNTESGKAISAKTEERILEEKLDSLHSLLEQQIQRREEKVRTAEDKEEYKESKEEKVEEEPGQDKTTAVLSLIRETLLENEVDAKYADSILDEVSKLLKPNMPMEHILSNVYQRMILRFG